MDDIVITVSWISGRDCCIRILLHGSLYVWSYVGSLLGCWLKVWGCKEWSFYMGSTMYGLLLMCP